MYVLSMGKRTWIPMHNYGSLHVLTNLIFIKNKAQRFIHSIQVRNITTSRNLDLIPLLRPASSGTKTNGSLSSTFHHPLLHVHHHQKACCFASTCHLRTLQQPHHHHPQAQVVLVEIPQSWIILEIDSSSDTVVQQVAERLNHIEDFSFSRKLYLKMSMFRTSLSERNQSTFCYSSKCSYQGKTACRSGHVQCS